MAVVGMAAGARPRQLIVSEVSEREIVSESLDVWNPENGKSRPENREETQGAASSLPILSFLEPWTSAITQVLSLLPDLASVAVQVLSFVGYLVGTGLGAAGTLSMGTRAVEGVGGSLQSVSLTLPHALSVVVVAGMSVLMLLPGVYDWILSLIASVGLAMAGHVTASVRSLVDENSPWITLVDNTSLFIRKLQRNFKT
ncbi:uncharacterized protein LOC123504014 isoform X2 [Portunus trituberculatus]|nr:uncharacterized protein LOC123504014 isoform X2 [Portunus trituberculatus]